MRISTEMMEPQCGCREAICEHTLSFPGLCALEKLTQIAAEAMYKKLLKKYWEGWFGWDDPKALPFLKQKLIDHVQKGFSANNMVDIMNLAAMIWNMEEES